MDTEQVLQAVGIKRIPFHIEEQVALMIAITYCFTDNPTAKLTVMIVDSASNPKLGIVNEETPLALALLGLSQGEDGLFSPPGGKSNRWIRVLRIERQEALPLSAASSLMPKEP